MTTETPQVGYTGVTTNAPSSTNAPNELGIASVSPNDLMARPDITGDPQWYYAEGVPGEGNRPEWLPDDMNMMQYSEQAKNFEERANGLRKQLGSQTHAPEEYTVSLDQEVADYFNITSDDPLITNFMETAKEADLSQEGFNSIINSHFEKQAEMAVSQMEAQEAEFKDMGIDADKTFDQISNWMNVNLSPEATDAFSDFITSAPHMKAMQEFISKTSTMNNIPSDITPMNFKSERNNQLDIAKQFMDGGIGSLDALNKAYNI